MRRGRARLAAVLVALAALALAGAPRAQAASRTTSSTCREVRATVTAGSAATVALDCRARVRGRLRWVAEGRRGRATRAVLRRPAKGTLTRLDRRRGTARYRARATATGTDVVRYRVRARGGRRLTGRLRIRIRAAEHGGHGDAAEPTPTPAAPAAQEPAAAGPVAAPAGPTAPAPTRPTPAPGGGTSPTTPTGDGLPARLPAATPAVSYAARRWAPSPQDTCPQAVHDRYAVIGPDGKAYPTWHPPTTVDPSTGRTCTFGHEHGRDPAGSDLMGWVRTRLAAPGREAWAGLPFGHATEALDDWAGTSAAGAHAGHGVRRQEDHVGYKVEYENDVRPTDAAGRTLGITCDTLLQVHQGSHSGDALANNVHEVLVAQRCDDGTELLATTVGRFGDAGEYTRSCDPAVRVATVDNGYPGGRGARSIPDRTCAEADVLVPAGRTTSIWALYEKWSAGIDLERPGGDRLATVDTAFGVFNPSRYAQPTSGAPQAIGRSVALCFETEAGGDRANGVECDEANPGGALTDPLPFDDDRSPFDGTYRDVYLRPATVANAGGPATWFTDPYGGSASTTAFPGAIRQTVSPGATGDRTGSPERVFGRNRTNEGPGVHAPN